MLRLWLLVAIASLACPSLARACVWLPYSAPTKSEKRYWSRVQTQKLKVEAVLRLKSGRVEVADELAELLVPNIRPIHLLFSDCGPEGEIDFAGGVNNLQELGIISTDPRLKDVNPSDYASVIRQYSGNLVLGSSCNDEFRGLFSDWLTSNLTRADLQRAWLFLVSRKRETNNYGSVYRRLVRFSGDTRRPPMRWWGDDQWISKDIDRFVSRNHVGQRLARAMKTFWARYENILDRDDLICPTAAATSVADRAKLIDTILLERESRRARERKPARPAN